MKEDVYFTVSLNGYLNKVHRNSMVFDSFTECIFYMARYLMSELGIQPTSGILMTADSNLKEYTLIERYHNQFQALNQSIYIYCVSKGNSLDNHRLVNHAKIVDKQKIENLYDFLLQQKDFNLVENENYDKAWYDIPHDNGDIIHDYFRDVMDEKDKGNRKVLIFLLIHLFPDQAYIIKKLQKLMFRMEEEEFENFIDDIFDKREKTLRYDMIETKQKKYSYFNQFKRFLKKDQ